MRPIRHDYVAGGWIRLVYEHGRPAWRCPKCSMGAVRTDPPDKCSCGYPGRLHRQRRRRRRRCSKKRAQMRHAQRRFWGRHNIELTKELHAELVAQIRAGAATLLERQSARVRLYLVNVHGKEIPVVYDRIRKQIVTALRADIDPKGEDT